MNKLRIPLSSVAQGEGLRVEAEVSEAQLRPEESPGLTLTQVKVSGRVIGVDTEYLFEGTLHGTFKRPCDRCLVQARQTIEVDAVWYFEPGVESQSLDETVEFTEADALDEDIEDGRVRFFEGKELDLAPHVWEAMVLEDPAKFYCSDECQGLCPQCGANLNEGACGCAPERETNETGLAALKDMFPNLPPESPED